MQSITKKDYMRFQMWNAEKINLSMREEFEKTGKNPHNYLTMIADMEHLSMRQMAYKPGAFNQILNRLIDKSTSSFLF